MWCYRSPTCFISFLTLQTEKNTTNFAVCAKQYCHLKVEDGFFQSQSRILLLYLNLELLWPQVQQHGTLICHSQAAHPRSPTRAFNTLPRNPVQNHVLTLTAFNSYIFITISEDSHFSNPVTPFLCITHSSALGHNMNAKSTDFNRTPTVQYW